MIDKRYFLMYFCCVIYNLKKFKIMAKQIFDKEAQVFIPGRKESQVFIPGGVGGAQLVHVAAAPINEKYELYKSILGKEIGSIKTCTGGWFKQEYESGAIYHQRITNVILGTPSLTNTYVVYGEIYVKYKAMGEGISLLGYPRTDTTKISTGSFNHFAKGSLYAKQGSSAFEIHGPIYDKWASLGWETGYLGYPTRDEGTISAPAGKKGKYWHFEHGSIYYNEDKKIGPFAVHEKITKKWGELKWEQGDLEYPVNDTQNVTKTAMTSPLSNNFQGGIIKCTFTSATSTNNTYDVKVFNPIERAIHDKYMAFATTLGAPVGNIINCNIADLWKQKYEKGTIYHRAGTYNTTFELHGSINDRYNQLGAENNTTIGYPKSDETEGDSGVRYNEFSNGFIYWKGGTVTRILGSQINYKWEQLGGVSGVLGFPTTDETTISDGKFCHFVNGSIYYNTKRVLGPYCVRKQVRDEWERQNWERGPLGWPMSDTESPNSSSLKNKFQGGTLTWTSPNAYSIVKPYTHVQFRITGVIPNLGDEDLYVMGVAMDNNRREYKINTIHIGNVKKGTLSNNGGKGWVFCELPITEAGWPKGLFAQVVLVEHHNAGGIIGDANQIANIQNEILNNIKTEISKNGADVGATLGTLVLPGIGTAIGYLAGTVLGNLIIQVLNGIFSAKKDKLLGTRNTIVEVKSMYDATYSNQLAYKNLIFEGNNYQYNFMCEWEYIRKG